MFSLSQSRIFGWRSIMIVAKPCSRTAGYYNIIAGSYGWEVGGPSIVVIDKGSAKSLVTTTAKSSTMPVD
jgi:hypothetical protein